MFKVSLHCKSDGGKIETCFTKLVSKTVKINFFICYLTIQLVNLGGVFPYWLGFQGVSPIGWYSKYCMLVDNGKGLFLWGDEFNLFFRLQC